MSEYARREFDRLGRMYGDRCPDHLSEMAIEQLQVSHSKMPLTLCQFCGTECRQFPWLLDQPSTCQCCRVSNAQSKGLPR